MRTTRNPARHAFRERVKGVLTPLDLGDFAGFTLPDNLCDRRIAYQDVNLAAHAIWGAGTYELRTDPSDRCSMRVRRLTRTRGRPAGDALPTAP